MNMGTDTKMNRYSGTSRFTTALLCLLFLSGAASGAADEAANMRRDDGGISSKLSLSDSLSDSSPAASLDEEGEELDEGRNLKRSFSNTCEEQEYYLRKPSPQGEEILQQSYAADLQGYLAVGGQQFLLSRRSMCGGKSQNFASLGRIFLGNFEDVERVLASSKQVRQPILGAGFLQADRVSEYLLLAISNEGTDTPEGATGVHRVLRENVISMAEEGLSRAGSGDVSLETYIDDLVAAVDAAGSDLDGVRDAVDLFVIRYFMKVLWDMEASPELVGAIKPVFLNPGLYFPFAFKPFASGLDDATVNFIQAVLDEIGAAIQTSPVLDDYTPSEENLFLSKKEFADVMVLLTGLGAINTGSYFLRNLFAQIPEDQYDLIDPDNHVDVGNAVLEANRLDAPGLMVNMVLGKPTVLRVGKKKKRFPAGTVVAAAIGLAGYDEDQFHDPHTFDHTRANVRDDNMVFNGRGISTMDGRFCPGRDIAMKMGMDVLKAWLERND